MVKEKALYGKESQNKADESNLWLRRKTATSLCK